MDAIATPVVAQRHEMLGRPALLRWLPLAGVGYAVLTIGGDLVIDRFPDESTPLAQLTTYYAQHHAQVAAGGLILEVSAVFVTLFGVALALRVSRRNVVAAAVIGVGAASMCLAGAYEGATFHFLGEQGANTALSPQALQAWHVSAAAFGTSIPLVVLVLGMALAGRALPVWLTASAVVLALAQLTPVAFPAGMLMLLWFVAAGVSLAREHE